MLASSIQSDVAARPETTLEAWCVVGVDAEHLPAEITSERALIRTRQVEATTLLAALERFVMPERLVALFIPVSQERALAELLRKDKRYSRTRLFSVPDHPDAQSTLDETELDTEYMLESPKPEPALWNQTIRSAHLAHQALGANPTMRYYFLDNKYQDVFTWFERTRWDWHDAPDLSQIDRSALRSEYLQLVKYAAIAEFGTLPGAHNFLREWYDEVSFSNWALSWGAEEARHSLLLCQYLRAVGIEVMNKHAMYKRKPYETGVTQASTLMMNVISETRAAESYASMANAAPEPVAAKVFQLLSRDEARHASAFAQFCKELCDLDARQKMSAMEQAYFWLAHQKAGGFKHPAGEFYGHTRTSQGFSDGEQALGRGSVDAGDASVIKMIRKIVGDQTIDSVRDVKRWIRDRI